MVAGSLSDMVTEMLKAAGDLVGGEHAFRQRQTLLVSPGWKREMLGRMAKASASPVIGAEYMVSRYMGMPFEVMDIPRERVEDWSGCRSPARAKRRAKLGHPQRVKVTYRERAFVVDKAALSLEVMGRFDRMAVEALFGEKD